MYSFVGSCGEEARTEGEECEEDVEEHEDEEESEDRRSSLLESTSEVLAFLVVESEDGCVGGSRRFFVMMDALHGSDVRRRALRSEV